MKGFVGPEFWEGFWTSASGSAGGGWDGLRDFEKKARLKEERKERLGDGEGGPAPATWDVVSEGAWAGFWAGE